LGYIRNLPVHNSFVLPDDHCSPANCSGESGGYGNRTRHNRLAKRVRHLGHAPPKADSNKYCLLKRLRLR
jgi:hypothetical protein